MVCRYLGNEEDIERFVEKTPELLEKYEAPEYELINTWDCRERGLVVSILRHIETGEKSYTTMSYSELNDRLHLGIKSLLVAYRAWDIRAASPR